MVMQHTRLLVKRQRKEIYIQPFGKFNVFRNGVLVPISGKAKEILALIVTAEEKKSETRKFTVSSGKTGNTATCR